MWVHACSRAMDLVGVSCTRARLSRAGLGRRACSLIKLLLRLPREELLQKLLGVFGAIQHYAFSELEH